MIEHAASDNVTLPFAAAARAASAPAPGRFGVLWGAAPAMRDVYRRIDKVARTAATVLVAGESGSGKELVARTIHDRSPRRRRALRRGQLRRDPGQPDRGGALRLREGRLHRGDAQHRGCFERAEGGTLFLDEITEMAPEMQVRLLRVLETGTLSPGRRRGRAARTRAIVAATNRDPQQAVRDGRLREDLLYRLAVFPIPLPPLREREGDAELLAERFLAGLNDEEGTRKAFTRQAIATSARIRGRATCASCATPSSARTSSPTTRWSSTSAIWPATARTAPAFALPVGTPLAEVERRRSTRRSTSATDRRSAAPRCSASASRRSTTGLPPTTTRRRGDAGLR